MTNIRHLYPRSAPANRVREFLARDWLRTKKHIKDALKLNRDYWQFRRKGFTHKASLFNARNAL